MLQAANRLSVNDLRTVLRAFCRKHGIRRLDIFGSTARGEAAGDSDMDMLVTFEDPKAVATGQLLEMAGEAEELVGASVDFVLREALERSPNRPARDHIIATAVCIYES